VLRNYLIGDGLTKAMTTWLEGERKNKEGREEYKMRNRWKTKDDEEGHLGKEMEYTTAELKRSWTSEQSHKRIRRRRRRRR
jgi:hypothetical protein